MIDIDLPQTEKAARLASAPARTGVEVFGGAEALAAYGAAARDAIHAPPQGETWTRQWTECVNPDLVAARIVRDGRTLFAIALEVVRKGPFTVARFPGGSHANGNFAATDRATPPLPPEIDGLFEAIARARPDIDLFLLERLVPELSGLDNPLLCLPHSVHPNIGLAVNLDGGFGDVLDRVSGKRKRKKHRSQARKFEAIGPIELGRAKSPAEVSALLDVFFTIKGERLRRLGIRDVFSDAKVRLFFKRLFAEAVERDSDDFSVDSLAVGGKIRAITGSSKHANRLICEFSAIANDDLTFASPGEYLFFESIQSACADKLAVYDFSVGDEPYKRLWCDIETAYFDIRRPTGFKGALIAGLFAGRAGLVRHVKSNPRIWGWLKRLRKGKPESSADESSD